MADPNPNSPLLPVFLKLNCSDLSSRGSRPMPTKCPCPAQQSHQSTQCCGEWFKIFHYFLGVCL